MVERIHGMWMVWSGGLLILGVVTILGIIIISLLRPLSGAEIKQKKQPKPTLKEDEK